MTTTTIIKNNNEKIIGFTVIGHAGYADSGSDIVCSAISALTITTLNSIEAFCKEAFHVDVKEDSGDVRFSFDEEPGHDANLILKVFERGITDLAESYGDYICITFKEV